MAGATIRPSLLICVRLFHIIQLFCVLCLSSHWGGGLLESPCPHISQIVWSLSMWSDSLNKAVAHGAQSRTITENVHCVALVKMQSQTVHITNLCRIKMQSQTVHIANLRRMSKTPASSVVGSNFICGENHDPTQRSERGRERGVFRKC